LVIKNFAGGGKIHQFDTNDHHDHLWSFFHFSHQDPETAGELFGRCHRVGKAAMNNRIGSRHKDQTDTKSLSSKNNSTEPSSDDLYNAITDSAIFVT
jgi:hypothetical protein